MAATTTLLTVDEAVATLRGLGRQVQRRGRNRWLAQCPAHDDNRPSLSLAPGEQVPLLLKCHAGCSFEEVMAVLRGERPAVPLSGHSGRRRRRRGAGSGPVHWYDYRDEAGRLLYQHGRTPEKEFPFRMPGAGRWGLQPEVRRVLYRLPALAAAAPGTRVFVVEGEKDADRLAGLGLVATCNDNGAGRWPEGCDHHFRGLQVVVLPDNDGPGKAHGKLVAKRLAPIAAGVRIVTLPGLPEKGDVSDWLDVGHTRADLLRQCRPAAAPAQDGRKRGARGGIRGPWPKGPGGKPAGFVVTLGMRRTSLAPVYEQSGSYRENPQQRHRWVLRHGKQVAAEAKAGPVYVCCLSDAAYAQFKSRQYYRRRQGERREWWGVPQHGGDRGLAIGERGVVVFHTDAAEGGERVPGTRREVYGLIDGLVDGIPAGRNPKGTKDWGRDYRTSRGDGREQDEAVIAGRAELLVKLNAQIGAERIAPYRGMAGRTVREIKEHVTEAPRPLLLGMLRDELAGKRRKSVLALLVRRIRMNAIQLWSTDSIGRAARALEIRLAPGAWRGTTQMAPEEAYRRLVAAGLSLSTRSGRPALQAFLAWLAPGRRRLRDSAQAQPASRPVQNPVGPASNRAGKEVAHGPPLP